MYASLLYHWVRLLLGRSYFHVPQGVGRVFAPGQLLGYFNDLSGKTRWNGPVDEEGLPLNEGPRGRRIYFPTTLFQKGLGHWDLWLLSGRRYEREYVAFTTVARWAVRNQDDSGGWPVWPLLGVERPSAYSAMTQGEGVSLLLRAYWASHEEVFMVAAARAISLLLRDVREGGTCHVAPEGLVLEEAPEDPLNTVLNGWVFALYGLYDYLLWQADRGVGKALDSTLGALAAYLPRYDAGFWSYYDLSGNLASPFYHRLHIAQLRCLESTFPQQQDDFRKARVAFEWQLSSPVNRMRALAVKVYQKLRRPPSVVLR